MQFFSSLAFLFAACDARNGPKPDVSSTVMVARAPSTTSQNAEFVAQDGQRLKLQSPDRHRMKIGEAWDSSLKYVCQFQRTVDGVIRCLPSAETLGHVHVGRYFRDSSCAEVALFV